MDKVKQSTEVTILGQRYALRSEFDQAFMAETANLVNQRMREIMDRTSAVSSLKVAVLAAMNIAGDLLRLRQDHQRLRDEVGRRSEKMTKLIDRQLGR